jgi:hypothetical protein
MVTKDTYTPNTNIHFTMPQPESTSFEPVYLDPNNVTLRYEGENLTFVGTDGTYYPRVILRRCFPLSDENEMILVRVPDTEEERGFEIGVLRDLERLNNETRYTIAKELKTFYFVPVIQQVEKIKEEFGFLYWSASTDRGMKEFILRDNIVSSTRQISANRWLLIDINQARFEIHNLTELDVRSQELIKRYLLL